MGKKDKNKKKGKGAEKTAMKTDKKLAIKHKKMLESLGERDIEEVVSALEQEQQRLVSVVEQECAPPGPRANFSLIAHPEKEELIMFGGELDNGRQVTVYNDMFFYNIAKNQWKMLIAPGAPTARSGHQMVAVATDGGQLWLFGGEYASPSQLQFYHFKDLWVFGLKTRQWEKIDAPHGPSARSGHRMVVSKKRLIIFGGFYDNYKTYRYFNDVHIFSLETRQWLQVTTSGSIVPAPRSGCCMTATPDGKIIIWGGYTKTKSNKRFDRGLTYNDMFTLTQEKENDPTKWNFTSIRPSGKKLMPLCGVSCVTAANGKVYCFGGVQDVDEDEDNVHGVFSCELFSMDLSNLKWNSCQLTGKVKETPVAATTPQPAKLEAMEVEPIQSKTVSSDGVFTVTVGGSAPTQKATAMPSLFSKHTRPGPTARMNAGLAVCKGVLYIFGGLYEEGNRLNTYGDFYALDLHKMDAWRTIIGNDQNTQEWLSSDSENDMTDDDGDTEKGDSSDSEDEEEDEEGSEGMETE